MEMVVEKMEESEEVEIQPQEGKISHSEGVILLEGALCYIEQQEETTPTDVNSV